MKENNQIIIQLRKKTAVYIFGSQVTIINLYRKKFKKKIIRKKIIYSLFKVISLLLHIQGDFSILQGLSKIFLSKVYINLFKINSS